MKPRPRIRTTIKWGSAAVMLLLALLWIGSYWFFPIARGMWPQSWCLGACAGMVELEWGKFPIDPNQVGLTITRNQSRASGFIWSIGRGTGMVQMPVWTLLAPAALLLVATVWVDARARRMGQGRCQNCNYDRAGLGMGAACPECGGGGTLVP